jgi:hypothetical protein
MMKFNGTQIANCKKFFELNELDPDWDDWDVSSSSYPQPEDMIEKFFPSSGKIAI